LEEQLHFLQARFDEVSGAKHSIGQSRRAKALRKEMTVIKRKLAQRELVGGGGGGNGGGGLLGSVGGAGERASSLLPHHHHPSSSSGPSGRHDEGGESSSQEIGGGKGESVAHTHKEQWTKDRPLGNTKA